MTRRNSREANTKQPPAEEQESPERWAPPVGRGWQITLAAISVVAWLAVLAYLAAYFSG